MKRIKETPKQKLIVFSTPQEAEEYGCGILWKAVKKILPEAIPINVSEIFEDGVDAGPCDVGEKK